jgi:hypothetical protein
MNRSRATLLAFLAAAPLRTAAPQVMDDRLLPPGTIAEGAMTLRATERALLHAAERDAKRGKVSRIALFELAFPDDSTEFAALGGQALMAVTALSWCQYELPLRDTYLLSDSGRIEMTPVTSVFSEAADSNVMQVYGGHRIDELFLVPVEAVARGGVLAVDFGKPPDKLPPPAARVCGTPGRDAFQLHRFLEDDVPADYLARVGVLAARTPDTDALVAFVRKTFPEFLAKPL